MALFNVPADRPIRQLVHDDIPDQHRYLVIVRGSLDETGKPWQIQVD